MSDASIETRPDGYNAASTTLFNQGQLNVTEFTKRLLYWTEELDRAHFMHEVARCVTPLRLLAKAFERNQ